MSRKTDMTYPTSLPGLLSHAERLEELGVPATPEEEYRRLLALAWRDLWTSEAGRDEGNLQHFLEHHPCLIPGFRSFDTYSGHAPFPGAVITQPKLPELSTKQPDFCWIATDSVWVYAILVEIETPNKRWFKGTGKRKGELHSDLVHAKSQLDAWKAWFAQPENRIAFLKQYQVQAPLIDREFQPHYVLIHGSPEEFAGRRDLQRLRPRQDTEDTTVMTFNRLRPDRDATPFACVRLTDEGYVAVTVPPTFDVDVWHAHVRGLEELVSDSDEITALRKTHLLKKLKDVRS
jgi:hypothetical protein